jgi:hypothetical protein
MTKSVTQACELRMMGWEWIMNWKGCGRSRPFSSLRFCPCIWSVRGTIRKLRIVSRPRFEPGIPWSEAESVLLQPVQLCEISFYIYPFVIVPVFISHSRNSSNLEICETALKFAEARQVISTRSMASVFLLLLVGWDWLSWYCGHYWPVVPASDDRWWWLWRNWWN